MKKTEPQFTGYARWVKDATRNDGSALEKLLTNETVRPKEMEGGK